jgi:hypothetical protein
VEQLESGQTRLGKWLDRGPTEIKSRGKWDKPNPLKVMVFVRDLSHFYV